MSYDATRIRFARTDGPFRGARRVRSFPPRGRVV